MLRFIVNGQATLGTATFWRIDDTKAMEAPGYDAIEFLRSPFALISVKAVPTREEIQKLIDRINAGES